MKNNLQDAIRELKKVAKAKSNPFQANIMVDLFDEKRGEQFDELSSTDKYISAKRNKCLKEIKLCSNNYYADRLMERIISAFNCYNEMVIYANLKKKNIDMEGLIENNDESSPDFVFNFNNSKINVDLKTAHLRNGAINLREAQQKINETNVSAKQGISKSFCIKALKSKNRNETIKFLCNLISKNLNDYQKQITYPNGQGIGVILIDLVVLGFPNSLLEALPTYEYLHEKHLISGCLWNACFCNETDVIHYGNGNNEISNTVGALLGTNNPAIIFAFHHGLTRTSDDSPPKLIGFYHSVNTSKIIIDFIKSISDITNDEKNSNESHIKTYINGISNFCDF